jgi:hypothetical protein
MRALTRPSAATNQQHDNMTTTTDTLRDLSNLINTTIAAQVVVCEFSSEDATPTLHIDLWRGYDTCDLPGAVTSLELVAEGHWDGGRSLSYQMR